MLSTLSTQHLDPYEKTLKITPIFIVHPRPPQSNNNQIIEKNSFSYTVVLLLSLLVRVKITKINHPVSTPLGYTILYYTIPYFTILYSTILYYTIPSPRLNHLQCTTFP